LRRTCAAAPAGTNGHGSREDLLPALAELDGDDDSGRVTEREYGQERARLKTQVKQVWQRGERSFGAQEAL
jgi:hypothetical protein